MRSAPPRRLPSSRPGWRALAAVLALGCAPTAPAGRAALPIVDGTSAGGVENDAVVAVLGGGLCSGTLIGPRLVMTAKHCVVPEGAPGPIAPRILTVGTGPSVSSLRARVGVTDIVTTPGPLAISVGADPVGGATGTDVAFLVLAEPLPGDIAPYPVLRESPASLVGTEVLAIGYGTTRTGGAGTRMQVTATITGITPFLVEAVEVVCQGDSGGPLLRVLPDGTREVVGVTSFGVFSGLVGSEMRCPALRDYWNRVDLHLDLLDEARLRAGECVLLGDEACNSLDDDCDGTIDEGCAAVGEACSADADCAFAALPDRFSSDGAVSATCSAGVCVLPCDRRRAATSCASVEHPFGGTTALSGLVCTAASTGSCEGECRPGAPGAADLGATCTADADCRSLLCVVGRCAAPCVGGALACAAGEACAASVGACGGCVPAAVVGSGRARGEPCTSGAECASGACGRAGHCTQACTGDRECGAGMRCDAGECALGTLSSAGGPCETSEDCLRTECGARGGIRFCGSACSDADPCPSDRTCVAGVCAPPRGVLGEACAAGSDCESGVCLDGLCTVACGLDGTCPIRTRCEREGDAAYCRRPAPSVAGGCAAAPGRAPSGALGVLGLALGLWLARRPARRASRGARRRARCHAAGRRREHARHRAPERATLGP